MPAPKIRCEHAVGERATSHHKAEIKRLLGLRRQELKLIETAIRQHADLARNLDLVVSIDGVGLRTAIAIIVRMPELGSLSQEKAASLLGVAPFIRQSGRFPGRTPCRGWASQTPHRALRLRPGRHQMEPPTRPLLQTAA